MKPRPGESIELIIDDHRSPKRGRKMACLSKIWDHARQRFTRGHVWVAAALRFRGVVLPWRIELWKARPHTAKGCYRKTTQIAAAFIREFEPPAGLKVRVLFDAFYLCPTVTRAVEERGFLWFSVAARNRAFTREGGKKARLGQLAPGWVRHEGRCVRMARSRGTRRVRIAGVIGRLHSIGRVQLVAAKRPGDPWGNLVVLATNATGLNPRQIVSIYERRWDIEVMFKELRSDLGLDDYQVLDEQALVAHVHLCALAHLLLTHHAMAGVGAQARKPHTEVALPTLSVRREDLRAALRADQITRLLGGSEHRELRLKLRPYLNAA
jgi:SRSO17 transposase